MTTLLTVLKGGGRYTPDWVARLAAGARQHVPGLSRVVCLSDLAFDLPGVERRPLVHGWPAWWSKMEAFRPGIADGRIVLCDLDTVFTGPAEALASGGFAAMEDHFLKGRLSSALMRWEGDALANVYAAFSAEPARFMAPGSCGDVPNAVHGDQVVIDHLLRVAGRLPPFLQALHPGLIDFYDPARRDPGPVVVFIGDAKPDNASGPVRAAWDACAPVHSAPAAAS